ncbi:hypothetical protein ACFL0H_01315 [Thermodesulfobacteriota bacterium]
MDIDLKVLLRTWNRIVSELASLQDMAPPERHGQIINPICKTAFMLDTACAANVFAAEYCRSQNKEWLVRAENALNSINTIELASGIGEPVWDVLGWHKLKGSVPVTGYTISAVWSTMDFLGIKIDEKSYESLLTFLAGCLHGKYKFAHHTIGKDIPQRDVQNTTALALFLIEYIAKKSSSSKYTPLLKLRKQAFRHLWRGQRKSGFWPYCYSGWRGKIISAIPSVKKIMFIKKFFFGVNFGDIIHHIMTLYFIAKYLKLSNSNKNIVVVSRGWKWIKRHFKKTDKGLAIDWSWEDIPMTPTYCNFRDTNCYFYILGLVPYLEELGVISKYEATSIINGILKHIGNNLLYEGGGMPCIVPNEGPPEVIRNILPMFEQGVALKGHFMTEIIKKQIFQKDLSK